MVAGAVIPSPMLTPDQQKTLLNEALPAEQSFAMALQQRQLPLPRRGELRVLQLNLGRLCNMRCSHCHVDAGPHQGNSMMSDAVVDHCINAMERLRPAVVDLTGGAPELHLRFRDLVSAARRLGCHVIDRCNLTVLLLPAMEDLPAFLADHAVEIVASLPQAQAEDTDAQRGDGTWEASIKALQRLNQLGYGRGNPERTLTLMSNPRGTRLQQLSACDVVAWKRDLKEAAGVSFDHLIGLNNMPIARFLQQLERDGHVNCYLKLLHGAFNADALQGLMCRDTLSVAADGRLHDCDFNQMLAMPLDGSSTTIETITRETLQERAIQWGNHCYGCTAGEGSSCAGATTAAS